MCQSVCPALREQFNDVQLHSRKQVVLEAQLRPPGNSNLAALQRVAPLAKICKRFQTGLGDQIVI